MKKKAEAAEEEICPVIEQLAQNAAEQFTDMAIELDLQGTLELVSYLEAAQIDGNGRAATVLMRCMFLAANRKESARELDLLDACYRRDPLAYDYFADAFMETEEIDWFMMEKIYSNTAVYSAAETGGGHGKM